MENNYNLKDELIAIREGIEIPQRAGDVWTPEERGLLLTLFQSGVGISEISLELKRTEMAVMQQLHIMGLFSRPNTVHHRKEKPVQCLCTKCNISAGCVMKNQTQSAFDSMAGCCSQCHA